MFGSLLALALAVVPAGPPGCELHLFGYDTEAGPQIKSNLFVQPSPRSGDPLAFVNIISPRDRMMDVSDEQYGEALELPANASIVRHWDVTIAPSVRKSSVPMISTPGRCHLELIGYTSIGFPAKRSSSGEDELAISFVLKQFSPTGVLVSKIDKQGYGSVAPAKRVGRDAALTSLKAASGGIIQNFGERIAKQRRKVR